MWTNVFSASAAILSAIFAVVSVLSARSAALERASLRRRMHFAESQLASLSTSQGEHLQTLEALANRVKMQRVRTVIAHPGRDAAARSDPDPYTHPDEWRKMMGKRLAEAKTGVKL